MKVQMYKWAKYLFPINRSLTGEGVRTLNYIKKCVNPNLRIYKISSGKNILVIGEFHLNGRLQKHLLMTKRKKYY